MGRGRSVIGTQVKEMLGAAFTSQEYGQKLLSAQGLDPSRLSNAAPMDDGIPPSPPTNVYLTAFLGSLNVEWDIPSIDDHVVAAVIEYTPEGGSAATVEVREQNGYVISDLEYKNYSIRVKLRDLWNRESTWSTAAVGKPAESADYKFNAERARQQGNLVNLVPAINQDLLAGENFAENSVRQVALATPEHPNQLPLSEVDFDAWPNGQVWPPPDTPAGSTTPYIIAEIPTGNTAVVTDVKGMKWLRQIRGSGTISGRMVPFAYFKERGVQPGKNYIASVWVQGAAGVRVRFGVEGATDGAGGTRLNMVETDVVTLDGSAQGRRVYFKFTGDPTYQFIRLICTTVDANTTTYWTKFQLEYAGNKTEPSPWSAGIMSTGVVNARMITAIDANIANAIFKTASIDSAAIKSLTADKITAGTIATTQIYVATLLRMASGGMIKAGNTELDAGGLSLAPQASYDTVAMSRDSKITDTTLGRSAIAFYQNNPYKWNGIVMRSDGDATHDGLIALHATRSGVLNQTSSARLELLSVTTGVGQARIWHDLVVERNLRAMGEITSDGAVTANGEVWGKSGTTWVALTNHSHPMPTHNHDGRYVLLSSSTLQNIYGSLWARNDFSAGIYYYNKGGTWSRVYHNAEGYLYV